MAGAVYVTEVVGVPKVAVASGMVGSIDVGRMVLLLPTVGSVVVCSVAATSAEVVRKGVVRKTAARKAEVAAGVREAAESDHEPRTSTEMIRRRRL